MTQDEIEVRVPQTLQENRIEEMFMPWVGRGTERSFKWVADQLHLPVSTIVFHAREFEWKARLARTTMKANELTLDKMAETIAQVQERHITELCELREKALTALREMRIDDPKDALKLFFESLKLERVARGMDEKKDRGDLVELLAERLKQLTSPPPAQQEEDTSAEFEFELDPTMEVEALEPPPEEEEKKEAEAEEDGMIPVKSSHVSAVRHRDDVLRVRFKDGSVYEYAEVPASTFAELLHADSIGRFLAKQIKPAHAATRLN